MLILNEKEKQLKFILSIRAKQEKKGSTFSFELTTSFASKDVLSINEASQYKKERKGNLQKTVEEENIKSWRSKNSGKKNFRRGNFLSDQFFRFFSFLESGNEGRGNSVFMKKIFDSMEILKF